MIIEQALFEPFALKFKEPFVFGGNTLTHKEGFHLTIRFGEFTGKGEVSILTPFGTPSSEEAKKFFPEAESFLLHRNPVDILSDLITGVHQFPAVVESAIEQAVLSLICNSTQVSPDELLNRTPAKRISVNGVVSYSDPQQCVAAARRLLQNGITTVKVKVGGGDIQTDLAKIAALREHFEDQLTLRLDANGSWSFDKAISYLPQFEQFQIEYIEQPVRECNLFSRLREYTTIKLAADECVEDYQTAVSLIRNRVPDVIIIKPLLIGGVRKSLAIAKLAKDAGIETVITTSLDGATGRRAAVVTAALSESNMSHGLSTGALFEHDPEPDYYIPLNGYIDPHDLRI